MQQALTDRVIVGGTYVRETQASTNYQLQATDATIHLAPDATIKAEYAESESASENSFVSTDGGINFNTEYEFQFNAAGWTALVIYEDPETKNIPANVGETPGDASSWSLQTNGVKQYTMYGGANFNALLLV